MKEAWNLPFALRFIKRDAVAVNEFSLFEPPPRLVKLAFVVTCDKPAFPQKKKQYSL